MKAVGQTIIDIYEEYQEYDESLTAFQKGELLKIIGHVDMVFSGWGSRPSKFAETGQASDMAVSSVACKYYETLLPLFEINRLAMFENVTKLTTDNETNESESTLSTLDVDISETTNGEAIQTQRAYPDGYTTAPDTAFISSQVEDSENTQGTNTTRTKADTKNDSNTHERTSTEVDNIARMSNLKQSKMYLPIVKKMAFECLGDTIEGGF